MFFKQVWIQLKYTSTIVCMEYRPIAYSPGRRHNTRFKRQDGRKGQYRKAQRILI